MNIHHLAHLLTVLGLVAGCSTQGRTPEPSSPTTSGKLFEQVASLDSEVFAAFNSCAQPEQLRKHAEYFSEAVEFYHDNGGVTWNRAEMLANTRKYACGNFRRELIPGSLRVYPIKNFGAIAQGVHRFCQFKTSTCEGAADFLIVWRHDDGKWSITRVFSYGHRPS